MNIDELRQWIGITEVLADQVTTAPLRALVATLDRDDPAPKPGDLVPPCLGVVAPQHALGTRNEIARVLEAELPLL